jgi:hypothetical protein
MVAVSTRHHLEQPTVGAAEDAESTVFGDPRHVGEHQTVVQLTTAVRSDDLRRRDRGDGPRHRAQLSD